MPDVNDAIAEVWNVAMGTAPATAQFARRVEAAVTAEITRLQEEIVGLKDDAIARAEQDGNAVKALDLRAGHEMADWIFVAAEVKRLNELNIQLMLELRAVHDRLDVERKEHREEMRDAGREYREMQSEINSLERQIEDRY